MRKIPQERTEARQLFPRPTDGETVFETPPCLSWLPLSEPAVYTVTLWREGEEIWSGCTAKNYIVPDCILKPGVYTWNITTPDAERGEMRFTVAPSAAPFLRPSAEEVLAAVPTERPRHLFSPSDLPALRERKTELRTLGRNVRAAYENGIAERPMFHRDPNALPYREYFGRFRDFLDRDLVALSLAYSILGDEEAGQAAKERLLTYCDWNPAGPCSLNGRYGDEVGLSMARCLPSVLDLLWPLLSPAERDYVGWTVAAYAEQCEARLKRLDFCKNPGDSHAGRLPAYLGEAAIVLSDMNILPRERLLSFLEYALDIYGGIFPYYGGTDGAWAEGAFYCSSYTRWYLPFFSAVERYTGKSLLARPFYRRLPHYMLHFMHPDFENHPFGDGYWCGSEDAEWPGFFAQNPYRYYADRFGPEPARRLAERAAEQEVYLLHLLDVFLPLGKADPERSEEARGLEVFGDTGYVSMHTALSETKRDFACLIRASRFGSDSHRHPDQGSFALFFGGVALVTPSGYFGRRYGTKHHMEWLNSTRAHNALLFNGEGQYPFSHLAVGKILSAMETDEGMRCTVSAGEAYPLSVRWIRHFEMTERALRVIDEVCSEEPICVSYPLHFLSLPKVEGQSLRLSRKGVSLLIVPECGDLGDLTVTDRFAVDLNEGEPEAYHVEMPPQYHAMWTTPPKKTHRISVSYQLL